MKQGKKSVTVQKLALQILEKRRVWLFGKQEVSIPVYIPTDTGA